jgi:hypothetical protein
LIQLACVGEGYLLCGENVGPARRPFIVDVLALHQGINTVHWKVRASHLAGIANRRMPNMLLFANMPGSTTYLHPKVWVDTVNSLAIWRLIKRRVYV